MNWKGNISIGWPKAYKLCHEFAGADWAYSKDMPKGFNDRDLFDFFDDREIYIGIHPMVEIDTGIHSGFVWNITHDDHTDEDMLPNRPRPEAESAAFEKAFQILEVRLNKEA